MPIFFSGKLGIPEETYVTFSAFVAFCLLCSAIYIFNDIKDRKEDKIHPEKRFRPIASGQIAPLSAGIVSIFLAALSFLVAFNVSKGLLLVLCLYGANNIAYTLFLKKKVVIDTISIAIGFVLRPIGGALAINVIVSDWLLICVFCLALCLGLGKRRVEIGHLGEKADHHRQVFKEYTASKLDPMLAASAAMTILAYMLYTTDVRTIEKFGNNRMLYGTPLIVYALFRYFVKVQDGKESGPVEILTGDFGFIAAGLCWLGIALWAVYG